MVKKNINVFDANMWYLTVPDIRCYRHIFAYTKKTETFSYTKKQTVRQGKFTTPFGHKVIKVAYWAIEIHK